MNIKINQEYTKLPPPLGKLEFNSFKESIKNLGQLDAIIVEQKGVIIAGYNRYRLYQELNIEPKK